MAGNKTLTQYIQMYLTGYNLWEFWPRFFVSLVDPGPRWGVSIHGSFPESERCVDGFPFSLALGTRFIFCGQTVLLVVGGAATFFWGWPTRNGEGRAGDAEWNHMEITKSLFLVEIQTSHTPVETAGVSFHGMVPWSPKNWWLLRFTNLLRFTDLLRFRNLWCPKNISKSVMLVMAN